MVDATLSYASDSAYNVTLYNAEVVQGGADHVVLVPGLGTDLFDSALVQTLRTTPSRVWDVMAMPVGYLEKYRLEQNWKLAHVMTFTAPMTYDSGGVSATATVIIAGAPVFSFPRIEDSTRKLAAALKLVEVG